MAPPGSVLGLAVMLVIPFAPRAFGLAPVQQSREELNSISQLYFDWYYEIPWDPTLLSEDSETLKEVLEFLDTKPIQAVPRLVFEFAGALLERTPLEFEEHDALLDYRRRGALGMREDSPIAAASHALALLNIHGARLERAKEILDEGRRALKPNANGHVWLLLLQADIASYSGDWKGGLALLDEAEARLERSTLRLDEPRIELLLNRARLADKMGLPDIAAPALEAARSLLASSGESLDEERRWFVDVETDLLQTRDRFLEAAERATQALTHEEWFPDPRDRNTLLVKVGTSYCIVAQDGRTEMLEPARAAFESVLHDSDPVVADRIVAHTWLARVEFLGGDDVAAAKHVARARELQRDFQPNLSLHQYAHLSSLEARALARREAGPGEREAIRTRLASEFENLLRHWSDLPPRAGGVGYLQAERTTNILDQLIQLDMATADGEEGIASGLERWLAVQGLNTLFRRLDRPLPSLDDLRGALVPGEIVLTYVPGTQSSHLFAFSSTSMVHAALPDARRVRDLVREHAVLVSTPPSAGDGGRVARLEQLGEQLSTWTWPAEVHDFIANARCLTIVGGDLFPRLSFESLPFADGRPLGLTHQVAHVPALPLLTALRDRGLAARPRDKDLLLVTRVGNNGQAQADGLEPLPVSDDDLRSLTRSFGSRQATLLAGEASSWVLAEHLPKATIVHILTHGVEDPDQELSRGIVLDDRSIFAADVEHWSAAPLVILSACGPGRGPFRRGDDGVDLGGAFLGAGALAVIQSESGLSYRATQALMETVHEQLASGASPAAALQAGRRALWDRGELRDPYYHSLLRVDGLGHLAPLARVPNSPSPSFWGLALIAGLILGALLGRARVNAPSGAD